METWHPHPPFKVCGSCGHRWPGWDDLLADPQIRLLGLQAVARVPEASVLVFEHRCGSSVSVLAMRLHHLVPEIPAHEWPSLRGTAACPGHCLHQEDQGPCDQRCRHRLDRAVLDLVKAAQGERRAATVG